MTPDEEGKSVLRVRRRWEGNRAGMRGGENGHDGEAIGPRSPRVCGDGAC